MAVLRGHIGAEMKVQVQAAAQDDSEPEDEKPAGGLFGTRSSRVSSPFGILLMSHGLLARLTTRGLLCGTLS